MADNSKIQWTDATWNPYHGCKKVSPGCKYCYMYRDKERYGHEPTEVLRSKSKFNEPLKWKGGKKIFTCSWSDFFIDEADEWRNDAWEVIRKTPQHTYQILTKRPERIKDNLPGFWDEIKDHVWIGVSVETREELWRADEIKDIDCAVRFISFEPLLSLIKDKHGGNPNNWPQRFSYLNIRQFPK
jgi:protein gp37